MVRLINDSGILKEKIKDLDNISFDQIVEAIHVVQTNMEISGISAEEASRLVAEGVMTQEEAFKKMGTTAKEASTTIQGSWSAVKASWTNLMVGMADDKQDIEPLMNDLSTSVSTAFQNILPKVEQVFKSIPLLISGLAPQIAPLVSALLPSLIEGTVALTNGLIDELPNILDALWETAPMLLDGILQIIGNIVDKLGLVADAIGIVTIAYGAFEVGTKLNDMVKGFQEAKLAVSLFSMQMEGASIKEGLLNGTLTVSEGLVALLTGKITLAEFASAMWAKTQALLNGVLSANPIGLVVTAIVALIAIVVVLYNKCEGFRNFINNMWDGIKNTVANIPKFFKEKFEEILSNATAIFDSIKTTIQSKIDGAKEFVKNTIDKIKGFFNFEWSLPKLKLPHVKIDGEFSLVPPKVPKFSIDWYKEGGILTKPTMFGFNPFKNSAMVGGESGAEAIAPISDLQQYVQIAVDESNKRLEDVLYSILNILSDYLPQKNNMQLVLDTGTLVGEITKPIDAELGVIKRRRSRY